MSIEPKAGVTILRDKANYREGIDPTNIEEVRLNDLKVQFLNRYLKAAPGEHGKLLESFVEKNSINGRAALTEADSKLLQDMAVAVDKDAQLTSKLTKAAETMPTAILRGLRGGAFVALVDEANYYTDVFAHHDSSKPAHPAITLAMGYVAPLAFFSGGIIKSAPEGAGFWARTANTFKRGGAAVGFSLAGAVGLTLLDHAVPFMRHSQFSNIMDPTTGESVVEGAAWVMPVAEEKTRWKMAGYTWLMGRATNLSNKEAAVAAVGVAERALFGGVPHAVVVCVDEDAPAAQARFVARSERVAVDVVEDGPADQHVGRVAE